MEINVDKEKKIIRIVDFKTDTDLFEKKYQKKDSPFKGVIKENTLLIYHRFQMSYYAYILAQFGYTTEGIDLDWLNPNTLEWERHSTEVIDLKEWNLPLFSGSHPPATGIYDQPKQQQWADKMNSLYPCLFDTKPAMPPQ